MKIDGGIDRERGAAETKMVRVAWRHVIAALIGGAAGYAYYVVVGCDSG